MDEPEINTQQAEIAAMTEVAKALEPLDDKSRRRVLRWAVDSFGLKQWIALTP